MFNVTIINDMIVEDDENFTLTIDRSSLPNSFTVKRTTVIILEDDCKY